VDIYYNHCAGTIKALHSNDKLNEHYIQAYITVNYYFFLFFQWLYSPSGPGPPHCRGFAITLSWTRHPGRVISPSQRRLPHIQESQETDIHAPGRIRTHDASRRTAADPRLRQRGHRGRHYSIHSTYIYIIYIMADTNINHYITITTGPSINFLKHSGNFTYHQV
jgi:hypothetical protein